jgi:hypothetical protein
LQWRRKEASVDWNDSEHLWNDLKQETVNSDSAFTEYNALLPDEVFHQTKSYTVQIRAIDAVREQDIKTFEIPTEDVALHLGAGGKKVAVGTYCSKSDDDDYTFYSDWKAIFDKEVVIGGSAVMNHVVEEGTKGIWTYRKWNNGCAELWGYSSATFENGKVLAKELTYPFTLTKAISGIGTLNSYGGNTAESLPWNLKLAYGTEMCKIWIHNQGGGFTSSSTVNASVYIMGRWK